MKALILIGGQGTRLRPFTLETPKPLLPIANRPFLEHPLRLIREAGIRDVVLCLSYQAAQFKRALGTGARYGLRFLYIEEGTPLGTGGAVKNAQEELNDTTLVFNGDILSGLDLKELLKAHRGHRADATISLVRVKDPTLYGLVESDAAGNVSRFVEKPSWDEVTVNSINAGIYAFEPSVLNLIPPGVPYSLERGLFPHLLMNGHRLFSHLARGYWMDIGTVEKYLQANLDILEGRTPFIPPGKKSRRGKDSEVWAEPGVRIGKQSQIHGRAALGRGCRLEDFVQLSGGVALGPGCRVGKGAQLENCVALAGAQIGDGAKLNGCVIGKSCRLEPHVSVSPGKSIADFSVIKRHSAL